MEEDVTKLQNDEKPDDATDLFVEKMEERLKNREIDTSILEDDSEKKAKEEKIDIAKIKWILYFGK